MKTTLKAYSETTNNEYNVSVNYNEQLCKGLLLTFDPKSVKENIKTLNIKPQIPPNKGLQGLRMSKHINFCILTIVLIDFDETHFKSQLIVTEEIDIDELFKSQHIFIQGYREHILNAIELLSVKTLEEAIELHERTKQQ
jgi:hypothetical protein